MLTPARGVPRARGGARGALRIDAETVKKDRGGIADRSALEDIGLLRRGERLERPCDNSLRSASALPVQADRAMPSTRHGKLASRSLSCPHLVAIEDGLLPRSI